MEDVASASAFARPPSTSASTPQRKGSAHTLLESTGSSPRYSKLRPPHGTRARLTPGPSITFVPLSTCSAPIAAPKAYIADGSHDMPTVSADGQAVTCARAHDARDA